MSHFSKVPVAVWGDKRLNLRHIKVLGAILAFADRDGCAHPTHRQISEICGIREKDIPTFTAQLCRLGWMEKNGNGGRSSPCDYTVKTILNLGVDNQDETTHESRVDKSTHNLGVDNEKNHPQIEEKTTPRSRKKPPPDRGKNHPQFRGGHTTDHHQTITRPSPDQLQIASKNGAEITTISAAKKTPPLTPEMQVACRGVWEAYATAYQGRYGVVPVRNAKVNRQVVEFVKRIGMDEAQYVAAHYLTSSARWYVTVAHSTDAMLKDAEKLRMEWATNRRITSASATHEDKKQAAGAAVADYLQTLEARYAT